MDVIVITQRGATKIVHTAADETCRYLKLLCGVQSRRQDHFDESIGRERAPIIVVGCLGEDSLFKQLKLTELVKEDLGEDDYLLADFKVGNRDVFVVAGGSGRSTLYAVYEFLELYGARFFLTGDVLPQRRVPFHLPHLRVVRRPAVKVRGLATILNFIEGTLSWDLETYDRFFQQMVKLRFNTFKFFFYPDSPWFPFEYRGVTEGYKYDPYTELYSLEHVVFGKEHFRGKKVIESPVFEGVKDRPERTRRAEAFIRQIMTTARERGLRVVIGYSLRHLAKELQEEIPKWSDLSHLKPDNPLVIDIIHRKVMQCAQMFPMASEIILWRDEGGLESKQADVKKLRKEYENRYGIKLADDFYPGDLETIDLLDKAIIRDDKLRQEIAPHRLGFSSTLMPATFPLVDRMIPKDMVLLSVQEYAGWPQVVRFDEDYSDLTAKHPTWIWSDLGHDMCGWYQINGQALPQNDNLANFVMVNRMLAHGIEGFIFNIWRIRGYEHMSSYLSRVCWNPELRPEIFYREFAKDYYGLEGAAAEKLVRAYLLLDNNQSILMRCGPISLDSDSMRKRRYPKAKAIAPTDLSLLEPTLKQFTDIFEDVTPSRNLKRAFALFREASSSIHNLSATRRMKYQINRLECGVILCQLGEMLNAFFRGKGTAPNYGPIIPPDVEQLTEVLRKLPAEERKSADLQAKISEAKIMARKLCRLWAEYLECPGDTAILIKLNACVYNYVLEIEKRLKKALSLLQN